MGDRIITGIDLGRESLKCVVLAVQKGKAGIETCRAEGLGLPTDADAAAWRTATVAALKKLRADGIGTQGPVMVTAPSAHTLIRALKVPTATFAQQLPEEAKQQLPFALEELDWSYVVVDTDGDQSHVSLAAIKKDINADLLDLCGEAGVEPTGIESGALALANVLLHAGGGSCSAPVAVLGIGATASNLTIADGTKVWMRTLPVTGTAIIAGLCKNLNMTEETARAAVFSDINLAAPPDKDTDAAKNIRATVTRLIMEITRSLTFYKSQLNGEKPQKLLLAGGYSAMRGLREFLADRLKMEIETFNPFAGMPGGPSANPQWYGEALGCALSGAGLGAYELNLLPKDVQQQRTLDRRKPFLVAAAYAFVAVFAVLFAASFHERAIAGSRLAAAQGQLAIAKKFDQNIKKTIVEMNAANQRNESLRRVLWDRDLCPYLLAEVSSVLPSNCWVSSVELVPFNDELERQKAIWDTDLSKKPAATPVVGNKEVAGRFIQAKLRGGCYGNWTELQPVVEAAVGRIPGVAKCAQIEMLSHKSYASFDLLVQLDWDGNGVADFSDITNAAIKGTIE